MSQRALKLHKAPDRVAVVFQTYRIGDLGIAAIPFEVFTETGLEIKQKSPLRPTFTIELASGSHGYLPTPSMHLADTKRGSGRAMSRSMRRRRS